MKKYYRIIRCKVSLCLKVYLKSSDIFSLWLKSPKKVPNHYPEHYPSTEKTLRIEIRQLFLEISAKWENLNS